MPKTKKIPKHHLDTVKKWDELCGDLEKIIGRAEKPCAYCTGHRRYEEELRCPMTKIGVCNACGKQNMLYNRCIIELYNAYGTIYKMLRKIKDLYAD